MSLRSYRAAPPRAGAAVPNMAGGCGDRGWCGCGELRVAGLPGLAATYSSAPIWRSTIGAGGFHGRVRDGIGCFAPRYGHQAGAARLGRVSGVWRGGRVWPLHAGGAVGKRVRAISTGRLAPIARLPPPAYRRGGLPRLSTRPGFEGGFPLRCVQRLSRPHLATRHCGGRHNRYTRGASLPVLSYWGERLASLEHPRQIGTELSHDVLNPAHVPL